MMYPGAGSGATALTTLIILIATGQVFSNGEYDFSFTFCMILRITYTCRINDWNALKI